jgi:hypothetical protein
MHEDAPHDVGNKHTRAIPGKENARAFSGRPKREIRWPQKPLFACGEDQCLSLIPNVVARGDDIGTGVDRIVEYFFGDAKAASGILAVDDSEVEFEVRYQSRQLLIHGRPARAAHHVTKKK